MLPIVAVPCLGDDALTLVNNSTGLSQAVDINLHGHIIGFKDVVVPGIGFSQESFFWDGDRDVRIPMLPGYTNTQVAAIADNGLVAGYAVRGPGDKRGSMEACVWDTANESIIGLGRLPDHGVSQAFDISDDGSIVVGYSSARGSDTMVPVVWEQEVGQWKCRRLSTVQDANPYLLTGRVVVSGDGSKIAACITVGIIKRPAADRYESSTFLWSRDGGDWHRELLSEHQLRMGDINDQGMLTGSCLVDRDRRAFVITPDREFELLEPLEGDQDAAGTDVNNAGVVVGYSDDPHGPEGGPTAFVYQAGSVRALAIPGDPPFSWAAAINEKRQVAGYLAPPQAPANESGSQETIQAETVSFVFDLGE